MIQTSRRGFLLGLLAAPVIVKVSSLMAVKPMLDDGIALTSMAHPKHYRWGTCDNDINPLALSVVVYGYDEHGLLVRETILLCPREQARIATARLAT